MLSSDLEQHPLWGVGLTGGLSVWLAWQALVPLLQASASQSWKSVPGTVISSEVSEGNPFLERPRQAFRPAVHYRYHVEGKDYDGSRIVFGMTRGNRNEAQVVCDRYPQGATVEVHYDPANPTNAVLERKSSIGTLGTVVMMIASLAMAGGALLFALG